MKRIEGVRNTQSRDEVARLADKYIAWVLDETNDRGRLDDDAWEDVASRIAEDLRGRTFT